MSFLTHLECGACGKRHEIALVNVSDCCGKPLLARYDLDAAKERVTRAALERGDDTMWRFRDVLPVHDRRFETTLGEGMTPLLRGGAALSEWAGIDRLLVKEEGLNPTASFKARGMSAAVSKARELGVNRFTVPSAGNAGAALSAYAARAGAHASVFIPDDTPPGIATQCRLFGAHVATVPGLITDAAQRAQTLAAQGDAFDVSTLKEPYRVEGKKTMAYEVALQLGWEVPDVLVYPTGGGTGIVGMWKALDEMEQLGLIGSKRPRLVTVQMDGCAPLVRAFHEGAPAAELWQDAQTEAWGLRVPRAIGDFLVLRALRESHGTAVAVPETHAKEAMAAYHRHAGILAGPEAAAALAGARALRNDGWIRPDETVVVFETGSLLPYLS